ncbi:DUF362 domain-containing protein [bacterium]|nr:DUF362 domain-containing protein [bacterium]
MKRRRFLKTIETGVAAYAGAGLFGYALPNGAEAAGTGEGISIAEGLYYIEEGKSGNTIPEIRPEILDNPHAVFLIETQVDAIRDNRGFFLEAQPQLQNAGKNVAEQVFTKGSRKGGSTLIKPNFTDMPDSVLSPVCGVNTSPDFIAGFVEGLRDLGNTNVMVGERGGGTVNHRKAGTYDVFDKHDIKLIEASYKRFSHYDKNELNWNKVSGKPVVWKNIPTFRPIGDSDNLFINMPKLKCHNLGLTTLAIKNLQGSVPAGYGHYCNQWAALEYLCKDSYNIDFKRDFVENYYQNVEAAFLKHRAAGFKYWDYENAYPVYEKKGGWETFGKIRNDVEKVKEFMNGIPANLMWDEQWCQRAVDSALAIKPGINIIEGVIGRDGSGFNVGKDELANIVVVGLSPLEVDAVGSYVMGQNPCELHYTRIANERGLGENNPEKIAIYWIRNNEIVPLKSLTEIRRTPLGVNIHTWAETGKRLFW